MVKKNNVKKIFYSQKFITFTGFLVILTISFPFVKNLAKQHKINKEINDLKQEISDLENKGLDLKNFVSYLESDQFAEEQARLNLNLKKPGEDVVSVEKDSAALASAGSAGPGNPIFNIPGYKKEEQQTDNSNPIKWLNYFLR